MMDRNNALEVIEELNKQVFVCTEHEIETDNYIIIKKNENLDFSELTLLNRFMEAK